MTNATKEQLADVIQAVRKIDDNHERMKDETIVKKLLNDKINLCNVLNRLDKQFPAICLAAVQQQGGALDYVKEQTPEICMAAVKQDGLALDCVKEQTSEICMAAVKEWGGALKYVKEQTPEICMTAINHLSRLKAIRVLPVQSDWEEYGHALEYVKEQTPEICMAAVKNDGQALQFVKDPALREEIKRALDDERNQRTIS
jgi:hypothetical protein